MKTEYQMEIIKKYIYLLRLENSWCLYNLRSGKFAFISGQYYNKHLRNDSARKNAFEAIINPISSNYTFPPQLDSNTVNRTQLYLVLPKECDKCKYKQICGGGCNSRRLLTEKSLPDMYCFVKNNEYKSLTANWSKQTPELVHSNYLCTLIVK